MRFILNVQINSNVWINPINWTFKKLKWLSICGTNWEKVGSNFSQRIASGFLRAREGSGEGISFCSFQILNSRLNQHEAKKHLKKLGFSTPKDVYCNFTSQVQIFRKQWLDKKLFTEYPTDGIVVKINSRKLQLIREKSYGTYPHWAMAIKD